MNGVDSIAKRNAISLRTIGNTFAIGASFSSLRSSFTRTVSSLLAGDCVDREILASQLRVEGMRATRQKNRPLTPGR